MHLQISNQGEISIFRVGGKVGWENSRVLDREVRSSIDSGARFLVFNLDDVEFLSSGAIGVLVYHLRKLQGGQGDIYIVTSNDYVLYLFRTIGFHKIFDGKLFQNFDEFAAKFEAIKGVKFELPTITEFANIDARNEEDDETSHRDERR